MSFFDGFSQFLTRFLTWAAACFVLFLLYTLVHETIEEQNSHLIDGETGTSTPEYRYPISESQNFEWNSRTILKHESVDWLNGDKIPDIKENVGRDDSRDGMNSASFEKMRDPVLSRRLKSSPLLLSLAPLQSPSLAPSSQIVKNSASRPDSGKLRSSSGFRAETLQGEIDHDSRFSEKLLKIGETTKDSNSIDPNFVSENLSSIEEGFEESNNTHISLEIEEKDEELLTNFNRHFEIYGEANSTEEVTSSEKYDVTNKADVKKKSNTIYMNGADFNRTKRVNGRLDPASKRNRIPSDPQEDKKIFNVRKFAQTTSAVQGMSEENVDAESEAKKSFSKYPEEFKENEKLESQESNGAQESYSKVLVSMTIASSYAGGGKTMTKLGDRTSPTSGKRPSFFTWLLRQSEASSFQKEDEPRSGPILGDGILGDELANTSCVIDLNCRLYNIDLAPENEAVVRNATCDKQDGFKIGACTCGDFCVSKSHDYDTKKVYYYCGPCGRMGSSCLPNSCNQSSATCKDSYCSCLQGDFYDLYYCVYNFNGYEKALQIAISICIALAIMLFVFTLCGARRRARGEEELSPFLMRLLLRRANEGTRESPPGDIPPSYEDVLASDQLPSYEEATKDAPPPYGLPPAEQERVSVTSLISLKGEENYGFQGDEESMTNTENPPVVNHAPPSVDAQRLQRGWEISDASPRDVRISISEDSESFEDDEFFHAIDPFAIGKINAELSAPTTSASYVQMDPSTGAIPKYRKREMNEHLNKLKRGPNRKLEKKKDIQSEIILQDSSSFSPTDAHQASNNANENCIQESDTHLALGTANPQNSLSSIELWTPIATDRHETNQGHVSELTQLNNLHTNSSDLQGTREYPGQPLRTMTPSYESDSVSNLIFGQNSHDNIENSKL